MYTFITFVLNIVSDVIILAVYVLTVSKLNLLFQTNVPGGPKRVTEIGNHGYISQMEHPFTLYNRYLTDFSKGDYHCDFGVIAIFRYIALVVMKPHLCQGGAREEEDKICHESCSKYWLPRQPVQCSKKLKPEYIVQFSVSAS